MAVLAIGLVSYESHCCFQISCLPSTKLPRSKSLGYFSKANKKSCQEEFSKKEIGKCKKEHAQVFLDERQMNSSFFHMSYAM